MTQEFFFIDLCKRISNLIEKNTWDILPTLVDHFNCSEKCVHFQIKLFDVIAVLGKSQVKNLETSNFATTYNSNKS